MKEEIRCPQCNGNRVVELGNERYKCSYCGTAFNIKKEEMYSQPQSPNPNVTVHVNLTPEQLNVSSVQQSQPTKSKTTAGILALLLGGFGAHKFYLGKVGVGFIYLLFCWTYIPSIIAFIEGISYLCMSDKDFQDKYE